MTINKWPLDFKDYCLHNLRIQTKSGEEAPLILNKYQEIFYKTINKCIAENKPIRIIILKPRQIGMSTVASAFMYFCAATKFNKRCMVIADDIENTEGLFDISKNFWELCVDEDGRALPSRPMKRYSNRRELVFRNPDENCASDPGLKSTILIQTAGKTSAGRSKTIHFLHCSEFAYWPNAAQVVTGLFNSVPKTEEETAIIIESTANGMEGGEGEEFYKRWQSAQNGDSGFTPLFFPWFWDNTYEMEPQVDFVMDEEEKKYWTRYIEPYCGWNIAMRKMCWRRYTIRNDMGSDIMSPYDRFRQEYPATPEEAFLASGTAIFDNDKLTQQILKLRAGPPAIFVPQRLKMCRENGRLRVFDEPYDGQAYAVGADIAEGLDNGDYSTMFVEDANGNQIMSWKGHIDPTLFGYMLVEVGKFYNDAVLAPEVNNMGIATLAKIKELEYDNIYYKQTTGEIADKFTKKLGWRTTSESKRIMIAGLMDAHNTDSINIRDIECLQEMMTVCRDSSGDAKINGKDIVTAACIAHQAIKQIKFHNIKAIVPHANKEELAFVDRLKKCNNHDEKAEYFI